MKAQQKGTDRAGTAVTRMYKVTKPAANKAKTETKQKAIGISDGNGTKDTMIDGGKRSSKNGAMEDMDTKVEVKGKGKGKADADVVASNGNDVGQ